MDDSVRSTNDDSATSKLSATLLGYLHDPYLKFFTRGRPRRSPLINRGYYARVSGVRKTLGKFFKKFPFGQLVNLGAGFDTSPLCIMDDFPFIIVFEVDFHDTMIEKAKIISTVSLLQEKLGIQGTDCQSLVKTSSYSMISCDMRNAEDFTKKLTESGFDANLPTLFLAECFLVYLHPNFSDEIIKSAVTLTNSTTCFVAYEQINDSDPFGETMVQNLKKRGCPLLGLDKYSSKRDQILRYKQCGWTAVSLLDMNEVYDTYLDKEELQRIEKLEIFDEFEEWRLIQAHYFILVAVSKCENEGNCDEVARYILSRNDAGKFEEGVNSMHKA